MAKCNTCRKAEVLDTRWDKIRIKFFHLFHKDIVDLSQEKYMQGFGDGYKTGREHEKEAADKMVAQLVGTPDPELTQFPLVVDMDKTVKTNAKGELFLNGVIVPKDRVDSLKREAVAFRNSELWEIMTNTIAHQAEEAGWKKSENFQDLLNSKVMVRTIDIQKNIIKSIENAK